MDRVTLKQLRYFAAVASHQHFGNAAKACAISQPALSLQIKELENVIGAPLIERTARKVSLTAIGEDFLARVQEVLARVDDLQQLARAGAPTPSGRLQLGVIPTIAPYLLPRVINALNDRFPELDVLPREAVTSALIANLLASRLDVALVSLPISEPAIQEVALFDEPFFLVRHRRDADKAVPKPEQLKTMRLLLLEEGHCFRDQALSFCHIGGSTPQHIMEGNSLTTLVQMVGAGIGATLLPKMALPLEMRSAEVSAASFPRTPPTRTIGMIWRKTSPLEDQFKVIAEVIRTSAEADMRADEPI